MDVRVTAHLIGLTLVLVSFIGKDTRTQLNYTFYVVRD
jgi:hypothetical protein